MTEASVDEEGNPIASAVIAVADNIDEVAEEAEVLSVDGGEICWIYTEPSR